MGLYDLEGVSREVQTSLRMGLNRLYVKLSTLLHFWSDL